MPFFNLEIPSLTTADLDLKGILILALAHMVFFHVVKSQMYLL